MASPPEGNAPSGINQGIVRVGFKPPNPNSASAVWTSPAMTLACGGQGSVSTSTTTRPLLVALTAHSSHSSVSNESNCVHSAPKWWEPQFPAPAPSKARTTPIVSIATGTISSVKPTQRRSAPSLRGKCPALRSDLDLVSSKRNSNSSSSPPGTRVTTKSNDPRADRATLCPGVLKSPRGKPLKVYRRSKRLDVNTATKSSPDAMASGLSLLWPKGAEKTAFSQRCVGRSCIRAPVGELLVEARQTTPSDTAASCKLS
mmetsp:Transcript_65827/g.108297  ORF Transcript_65827/g.108297 Transcript_65827/m.108297 type:complete len:258 (-) Transcript_65827:421-1194(-)